MSNPALGGARQRIGRLGTHAALVVVMLIWIIPVVALFVSSFRPVDAVNNTGWWTAFVPPFNFSLDNYVSVLTRNQIGRNFINSALITVPATLIALTLAAITGYVFARWKFRGREILFLGILILLSVPLQMTLVPVLQMFSAWGIVGTFPAVWIAHVGYAMPFTIYLLRNFFAGIPNELFESASVDGASDLAAFIRIGIPLAAPALAAVAVFEFMFVWNDLLVALIYLGGSPDVAPLTMAVTNMVNSRGEGWQVLTAAAFILMLVPLIVFFALQRHFVRGLTAGAIK